MNLLNFPLIILIYSITFTATAENKVIELNTTGTPPLNTTKIDGFIDLIAKEALSRIGITLKTVHLPAERGLIDSNTGVEDGELVRIKGLDKTYTNLLRVPEKIMDWEFVAFSKNSPNIKNGWQDLEPHAIAIVKGWKILERSVPPSAELIKAKTVHQMFALLRHDRVNIAIYEKWGGLLEIKNNNDENIRDKNTEIKILSPPLTVKAMYIYLHKKHKNIIPALDAALKNIKKDGTYQKIYNKILSPLEN